MSRSLYPHDSANPCTPVSRSQRFSAARTVLRSVPRRAARRVAGRAGRVLHELPFIAVIIPSRFS